MQFELNASIPGIDLFHRHAPAADELTDAQKRIAIQTIDFCSAVLETANKIRPERRIRDLTTAALFRRAIVSAEGIRVLFLSGLLEPATACARTLLDLEVAFKILMADETDKMARRLAAHCALQYKKHGQHMMADGPTREKLSAPGGRRNELIATSAKYDELLNSEAFDDVREAVLRDQHWHGFKNTKLAFESLGLSTDYVMLYDSYSWFVHGVNVEHDLAASTSAGPELRAFAERDPQLVARGLCLALIKLLDIVGLFCTDRGFDTETMLGGQSTVRRDDGVTESIPTITALHSLLIAHFGLSTQPPTPGAP